MKSFNLNRNLAQFALLQKIEIAEEKLKRIRCSVLTKKKWIILKQIFLQYYFLFYLFQ